MLLEPLARGGPRLRRQRARNVFLEGENRFGLRSIALDDGRHRLLDGRERLVHDLGADAARQRVGSYARQPVRERRPRRFGLLRRDDDREQHDGRSASLQACPAEHVSSLQPFGTKRAQTGAMAHQEQPLSLEIPWRTILKLIAAVALVYLWLELWQIMLVLVVA